MEYLRRRARRAGRCGCRRCSASCRRGSDASRRPRARRGRSAAERPDVLHTHTAKAGGAGRIAAALAARSTAAGVVHTYHGHVLRGYFGRGQASASTAGSSGCSRRRTSRLIAVSEEVRDDLVALGVAPRRSSP